MGVPPELVKMFIEVAGQKTHIFNGADPYKAKGTYIPSKVKHCGVVIRQNDAHAQIIFEEKSADESTRKYDLVHMKSSEITLLYGGELDWQRKESDLRSKINTYPINIGYKQEDRWQELVEMLSEDAKRFFNAVDKHISLASWGYR